jgi:hypothetical protein
MMDGTLMRRIALIACLTCVSLIGFPMDAAGYWWWSWIRDLSPPGPFQGQQIDIRVICLGSQPEPISFEVVKAEAENASEAFNKLPEQFTKPKTPPDLMKAVQLATELARGFIVRIQGLDAQALDEKAAVETVDTLDGQADRISALFSFYCSGLGVCIDELTKAAVAFRELTVKEQQWARTKRYEQNRFRMSAGVGLSLCRPRNSGRPVSVSFIGRFLDYTDPSETNAYAGGNQIDLTTLGLSVMYRPRGSPADHWWDFFAVGGGASYYHFSSRDDEPGGFTNFSGWMIEAPRFELHVPSALRNTDRKWRFVPYFHFGWVRFVDGFDQNAFGHLLTGPRAAPLPEHFVFTRTLFWDLTTLIWREDKPTRRQ